MEGMLLVRALNIHGVNDVRLDPKVAPVADHRDVLVEVKACGICGSDLTYIRIGGMPREPGGLTPIGHEAAGVIVSVGKDVKGLSVGQRVVINPMTTPSNIGSGGPEGAFTDLLLVKEARAGDNLLSIPDDVPFDIAALSEPLAVALHGVNRAEAKPTDKAVVFGCGPIGLGMVLWLADQGLTDIVAVDLADERLECARKLGASVLVNPQRENLRTRLMDVHGRARVLSRDAVGTDIFLDAAGAPSIPSDVVRMAKFHSRMVISALYMKDVPMSFGAMLTTEMTITTAMGYPTEMPVVVAALSRLHNQLSLMISHRYPFDKVIEALGVAGTPQSAKVMIEMADAAA
jgi:(R,R)-butanediol dehydrogenase/meso-butanediol dehydrogenase/diacetyl reductase